MALGISSVIIIFLVFIYELKRKSISIFLWASVILFFCFGHISFIFSGTYESYITNTASWFVIIFCVLYLTTRLFTYCISNNKRTLVVVETKGKTLYNEERFANICFWLLIVSTALYCISLVGFTGSLEGVSKSQVYSYRYSNKIVLLLNYAWSAGVPAFLWYFVKGNKSKTIISAGAIIAMSMFSGTRTQLIALFVMIALHFLYSGKRIQPRTYVVLGILGITAVYFMLALRAFRYYYSFADLSKITFTHLNELILRLDAKKTGDLYLCDFFYGLIRINNNFDGLGRGEGCIRLLMLPIPSSLSFGLKPGDLCLTLGRLFGGEGAIHYSVTPTLFGDAFANLGIWGGLLGILWGVITQLSEKLCLRKSHCLRVFFSVAVAWAFINVGRGDVYNAIAGVYYTVIVYGIIFLYVSRIRGIRIVVNKHSKGGRLG